MTASPARPIFAIDPNLAIKPSHLERYAPAVSLDREMRRVMAGEAVVDLVLGAALAVMKEGGYEKVGPARWKDYCREHLGLSAPTAGALIYRAGALRNRPVLLRALLEGRLKECPASALLEHLPADGSCDAEWVEKAGQPLPILKAQLKAAKDAGLLGPRETVPTEPETPLQQWLLANTRATHGKNAPTPAERGPGEWWDLDLGLDAYANLLTVDEFVDRVAGEDLGRTLRMEVLAADFWSGAPLPDWQPGRIQVEEPQAPPPRDPLMAVDLEVLDRAWGLVHEEQFELRISEEFLREIPRHPHRLQEYIDELLKCRQRLALYLGRMLRLFRDAGYYRKFNFRNIAEYGSARLGLSPSTTYEIIDRDGDLTSWHLWEHVYEGTLSLSQAALLIPMMVGWNQQPWVDFARHLPVRELKDWVTVLGQLIKVAPDVWVERLGAPPSPSDTLEGVRELVKELREERLAAEKERLDGYRSRGEMPPEVLRMWAAHLVELERVPKPKWHMWPPGALANWTFRKLPSEFRPFTLDSLPQALRPWVAPLVAGEGPWPLESLPPALARDLQAQVGEMRCYRSRDVRRSGGLAPTVRTFCPEDLLPKVKVRVWVPDELRPVLLGSMEAAERLTGRALTREECVSLWLEEFQKTWEPWQKLKARARRLIFERQRGRCAVPGCTCRRGLQDHHLCFRSHGGGDELSNRVLLCARHHLAHVHLYWLRVLGKAPDDLTWWLGLVDGEAWQVFENSTRVAGRGMLGCPADASEPGLEATA